MDLSALPATSTASNDTSYPPISSPITELTSSARSLFQDFFMTSPPLSNFEKLDAVTKFVKVFYEFQKNFTERTNTHTDNDTLPLRRCLERFIVEYKESLANRGPIPPFDQTILLIMEGIKTHPYIHINSNPGTTHHLETLGTYILETYPKAHPAAVACFFNYLSLCEPPSASGHFTSDCQFAILYLTSTLDRLGSFLPEEHALLVEAIFPLRLDTYTNYATASKHSDAHYTDGNCPRPINGFLRGHPLFPFDESSLLEKRKEIATACLSSEKDPITWNVETENSSLSLKLLPAKWFFLVNDQENFVKAIDLYVKEYFASREAFSIDAFMQSLSIQMCIYFSINTRSWVGFPYIQELLTSILSLPIPLEHFIPQIPSLLEIADPESQEILFDHLMRLYTSLALPSSRHRNSLWNYLNSSKVTKPPSYFRKILLQVHEFMTTYSQIFPKTAEKHPSPHQITEALALIQSPFETTYTTLSSLLQKAKKNIEKIERPSRTPHLAMPQEGPLSPSTTRPPSAEDLLQMVEKLTSLFSTPLSIENALTQVAALIQQFNFFQESLRNIQDGAHDSNPVSLFCLMLHDRHPKLLQLRSPIETLTQTFYTILLKDKTLSLYTEQEQTIALLLKTLLLSPYIYGTSDLTSFKETAQSLLITYNKAHPAAIAYVFYQLSLHEDLHANDYFSQNCHTAVLMANSKAYDSSTFSLQEHACMRTVFSPIYSAALLETFEFIRNLSIIYLNPQFSQSIDSLLQLCPSIFPDTKELLPFRARVHKIADCIIKQLAFGKLDTAYSFMELFHYLIYPDLPIPNQSPSCTTSIRNLYRTIYRRFFCSLIPTYATNPLEKFSFPLLEMDRRWTRDSILQIRPDLLQNTRYIQDVILSSEDPENPVELLHLLRALLPTSLPLLLKIEKGLTGEFRQIFLHAIVLAAIDSMHDQANPHLLETILSAFANNSNLLKRLSLRSKELLFFSVRNLYCTLPEKGNVAERIPILLWSLLLNLENTTPSSSFKPILTRYLTLLVNHPALFPVPPAREDVLMLTEALLMTEKNEPTTLQELLERARSIQEEYASALPANALFKAKLEELNTTIASQQSKMFELHSRVTKAESDSAASIEKQKTLKQEITYLNQALEKAKKRSEDMRLSLENRIKIIQAEVAQKCTLLEEKTASIKEKELFADQKLQQLQEQAEGMIARFLRSHPILCRIHEIPIQTPCLVTVAGQDRIQGFGNNLCEYRAIREYATTHLKISEEDLSLYITRDPLVILPMLLEKHTLAIYQMDTTAVIEHDFQRIQKAIKELATIPCLQNLELQAIREEKLLMLTNARHYSTIAKAFAAPFVQNTASLVLEDLVNHVLTLAESSAKFALTYMNVRENRDPNSPHVLLSTFRGQRVSAANSHRIVTLLRGVCFGLRIHKQPKCVQELQYLSEMGANSVRPEYFSSVSSEPSLENILSGLRFALDDDLESDQFLAAGEQIRIIIDGMQHLISFTADLLEKTLQAKKV